MATLLVKNAEILVTMDAERQEIQHGAMFIRDGWIEEIGPSDTLSMEADEILDLSGHIVLPGLINTHH
ncbi:MAG: 8-oxoguanine deaminase, partial [Anaerolineales bacterium]